MKKIIEEKIEIPEGISCEYKNNLFICRKDSTELSRKINLPNIQLEIKGNSIVFNSLKSNKEERKIIFTHIKHIKNMFRGLNKKFIYQLESCNVHFPMVVKVNGDKLLINNFLGEKIPRTAKILPNVNVTVKGNLITVESADREAAGQTAANFEKATIVKGRDRRIFQDGIYITEKPEREE